MVELVREDEGPKEQFSSKKAVFYFYDEAMLLHRDHNYHSDEGKLKTDLPEERTDDFISPEVPFRIRSIYEYL